ncbi:SusD/RagB family nutrient-binding outer membrane lipoprotein [Aliifodinibius salipaludis]|uniref:SusD/RagB family nutrient-binding outer membrane lipoprotein n=1 Tax=Fodinibius salipaludis TaxID=2032627 RepID=A0A2A2G9K2_9BACT|nr:SusD/RagB family nutrient-binding outer membrane lipoprotein [Aliifodinibius salipaludis]PAU93535.1 SusD/RagB family nutrient-binding outer membrane lipoprotein [Aliifodinibius salipaludis]
MKSLLKILAMASLALLIAQCEVIDSNLLEDPNNPSPEDVNVDFLFNNIQQEARNVYAGAADEAGEMSRMTYMFGATYADAYTPTTFDGLYSNAYADLFIDVENLIPIAEERDLTFHTGAAKVLKAYAMITLVDVYGDVPLSNALDQTNFNPELDGGAAVYDSALVLLDDAIADLETEPTVYPDNDLYYGSFEDREDQVDAWIRAANTIKLKAYLNTDNASAIQSLVDEGMLITTSTNNFTYQFGTNSTNPDSRHPSFSNNYVDVANDYMSVNYLNMMLNDKGDVDPRTPYYFYRQTTSDPTDVNLNTCISAFKPNHFQQNDPFCLLGNGYWGRDHLIDDGIPPDGDLRTTFGVYPVGGAFDTGQEEGTEEDMGLQGAGFDPILMSSFTHFMLAEYEYRLNGNAGAARNHLETAMTQSLETVRASAGTLDDDEQEEMSDNDITNYVDNVLNNRYDDAGRDELRVISKEFYLALWTNGLEAYNMMRRTGYPNKQDNLQPARSPNPGSWYNSFLYPASMVERNNSVSQKDRSETVFWDDGTYNFDF